MSEKFTVLICDDNEAIHESMSDYMKKYNIKILSAYDGASALDLFHCQQVDCIVLDIMLPDTDGIEVCRQIRRESSVPILFLSAKSEEIDRILGLELGGDDYVTKPFSPREVSIRVRKMILRNQNVIQSHLYSLAELTVDAEKLEVSVAGETLELTVKEAKLLRYLIVNKGNILSREQILYAVWGYDYYGDNRAVDAVVKRIRHKLPEDNVHFDLKTVYGVGYCLREKS